MTGTDDSLIEMPKWDVALESMVAEEYGKAGRDLTNEDFIRLARENAIRYDDIMETVFKLCIHDKWEYRNEAGDLEPITQDTIDRLYVNARLQGKDLRHFTGGWRPRS